MGCPDPSRQGFQEINQYGVFGRCASLNLISVNIGGWHRLRHVRKSLIYRAIRTRAMRVDSSDKESINA